MNLIARAHARKENLEMKPITIRDIHLVLWEVGMYLCEKDEALKYIKL